MQKRVNSGVLALWSCIFFCIPSIFCTNICLFLKIGYPLVSCWLASLVISFKGVIGNLCWKLCWSFCCWSPDHRHGIDTILGREVDPGGDSPNALGENQQFSLQIMFTSCPFNWAIVRYFPWKFAHMYSAAEIWSPGRQMRPMNSPGDPRSLHWWSIWQKIFQNETGHNIHWYRDANHYSFCLIITHFGAANLIFA